MRGSNVGCRAGKTHRCRLSMGNAAQSQCQSPPSPLHHPPPHTCVSSCTAPGGPSPPAAPPAAAAALTPAVFARFCPPAAPAAPPVAAAAASALLRLPTGSCEEGISKSESLKSPAAAPAPPAPPAAAVNQLSISSCDGSRGAATEGQEDDCLLLAVASKKDCRLLNNKLSVACHISSGRVIASGGGGAAHCFERACSPLPWPTYHKVM